MLRYKEKDIILLVYVDNVYIAAKTLQQVQWFKDEFRKIFKVKDLGEIKRILGIRITRDRKRRTLRIDQTYYLSEVLDDLHISADKHHPTALPICGYQALRPSGPEDKRIDPKVYQYKVGKLIYTAIYTRPDICFALGRLSQYLSDPAEYYKSALKTLLRYIRSTINLSIIYGGSNSSKSLPSNLRAFSDLDYAADRLNRKLILGYVYIFAGGLII